MPSASPFIDFYPGTKQALPIELPPAAARADQESTQGGSTALSVAYWRCIPSA